MHIDILTSIAYLPEKKQSLIQKTKRDRILVVLVTAGWVTVFNWIYVSYLFPNFAYFGFSIDGVDKATFLVMTVLAIVPAFWMPVHLERPSHFIYWTLYAIVYIPSMFVPAYVNLRPHGAVVTLGATLLMGMIIIGVGCRLPAIKVRKVSLPKSTFWIVFITFGVLLLGYIVSIYGAHFRFVSFEEIYEDIRFSGGALSEGNFANYAIMVVAGAVNPFLMAFGIVRKKYWFYLAGAFAQVLLYATAGQKLYLMSVIIFPLLFFGLLTKDGRFFGLRIVSFLILLCVVLNMARLLSEDSNANLDTTCSLLFMRTLGIPGLSTAMYQSFFVDHPLTYYSHVQGISSFLQYPYSVDLGLEVGLFFSGNTDLDANAHLWCTDGLAALGLPGILVISVLCGLIFWVMDSIVRPPDIGLATMLCILPAMTMANTSLFTTIWSGGFGLVLVILFIMPKDARRLPAATIDGITARTGYSMGPPV